MFGKVGIDMKGFGYGEIPDRFRHQCPSLIFGKNLRLAAIRGKLPE